ncbi:MAG: carotenoid 1,2-hydratase [Deltaproteobacteria bacterium]|jgi:predicted secreted hydrolase|nr:carotenoid 1,2-hydratase [Deltaproteobacteria bacterium]
MKKFVNIGFFLVIISIIAFFLFRYLFKPAADNKTMRIHSVLGADKNEGNYTKAIKPINFRFPDDAGPHPDFKSEWWYFTGNLSDDAGAEYGYQFTIFRQSILDKKLDSSSDWRTNQVYMAHIAVTDVVNDKFYSFSKMTRGSAGLAGAKIKPFRVWIENWEITGEYNHPILKASTRDFTIDIQLNSLKPIVLNGNRGLSQKSQGIGNASYYYSIPRFKTKGELTIKKRKINVSGESWLDREWSTSSLGKEEVGWDWFSIQLEDSREVMLYKIRKKDGQASTLSSGTYIKAGGASVHLTKSDFTLEVLDYWQSAATSIKYPSKWRIKIPKFQIDLVVTPKINNQEHQLQFIYWEGTAKVVGDNIQGNAYVELVGYK